ncbi:MAG TPA: hypothetical protein VEH29_02425 [Acidimicrobiales bacterium]|nr:hypothetical protein [Acidimicrobiales bacterium]
MAKRPQGRHVVPVALAVAAVTLSCAAVPPAAAQARGSRAGPTVSHFHATPAQLGAAGGRVLLTGRTTGTSRCEFTSGSAIKGLPVTVPCGDGRPAITVSVPANHGSGVHSISFQLTAEGAHGAYEEEGLFVHVLPRPAVITSFSASASTLSAAGGTVTLTARVVRALECVITSSPKVAGLPASLPCAHGTLVRTVTLPPAAGGATVTYDFALAAAGLGGGAPTVETSVNVTGRAPSVSRFTATPPRLSHKGGTVTLTITVANASECGFGYTWTGGSDPINGNLGTIACTSGTYRYKVSFARNTTVSTDTVTFEALVTSDGGDLDAPQQPAVIEAAA